MTTSRKIKTSDNGDALEIKSSDGMWKVITHYYLGGVKHGCHCQHEISEHTTEALAESKVNRILKLYGCFAVRPC